MNVWSSLLVSIQFSSTKFFLTKTIRHYCMLRNRLLFCVIFHVVGSSPVRFIVHTLNCEKNNLANLKKSDAVCFDIKLSITEWPQHRENREFYYQFNCHILPFTYVFVCMCLCITFIWNIKQTYVYEGFHSEVKWYYGLLNTKIQEFF